MRAGVKRYDNEFIHTEPLLVDTSFLLTVRMMPKIRVKSVSIIKTNTSIVKEIRQDCMIDFTIIHVYTITWVTNTMHGLENVQLQLSFKH